MPKLCSNGKGSSFLTHSVQYQDSDQKYVKKTYGEKNVDSKFEIQLEEDGDSGTRQLDGLCRCFTGPTQRRSSDNKDITNIYHQLDSANR